MLLAQPFRRYAGTLDCITNCIKLIHKEDNVSGPIYLQGDDYALNGTEDDIDENDTGLPDRMWEDDE